MDTQDETNKNTPETLYFAGIPIEKKISAHWQKQLSFLSEKLKTKFLSIEFFEKDQVVSFCAAPKNLPPALLRKKQANSLVLNLIHNPRQTFIAAPQQNTIETHHKIGAYAGFPLFDSKQKLLGALSAYWTKKQSLNKQGTEQINFFKKSIEVELQIISDNNQLNKKIEKSNKEKNKYKKQQQCQAEILDALPYTFFVLNAQGKIKEAKSNIEISSFPAANSLKNLELEQIIGEATAGQIRKDIDIVLRTKKPLNKEYLRELSPQKKQHLASQIIPYTASSVLFFVHDVSKSRQLEIDLKIFSLAIESSPASVVITDHNGKIEYVNSKFTEITGYQADEVIGENPRILKSGKHTEQFYNEFWNTLLAGKNWKGEFLNRRKDGQFYWELSSVSPLKSPDGKLKFLAVKEDITKIKESEEELIEAKKKAEESDRLKSSFLANLSHEIRTPMNSIIGFSDLLKMPNLPKEKQNRFVSIINQNSRILLNLIDDIIEIAKIEAGQLSINATQICVYKMLTELYVLHSDEKNRKGKNELSLHLESPPDSEEFVIFSDMYKIRQVLSNLIANAIKFTEKGSIHFGFTFDPEETITFFVRDTGIGIKKEKQKVIFSRFGQIENSTNRNYGGTGLGLAIAKKLVELLGGKIWFESDFGNGSSFYFTVPVGEMAQKKKPAQKTPQQTENNTYNWKEVSILIAEDEDHNYIFLKEALDETSAKTLWAKNGIEAIELLDSKNPVDIILMDIKMPEMDGYEATRLIKRKHPHVPIIAQTAFAMANEEEKIRQVGCDAYIKKPINKDLLLKTINKFLEEAQYKGAE